MKDYDKNEGSSYIHYWDGYSLHGWAMLLKLPVNHFQWIEDTSRFNENFIKIYCEEMIKDIFSKLMFIILKYYVNFMMIYHVY